MPPYVTKVEYLEKWDKNKYIRKVYALIILKMGLIIGTAHLLMRNPKVSNWIFAHVFVFYFPMALAVVFLLFMLLERNDFPGNLLWLTLFSAFEEYVLGATIAHYSPHVAFQVSIIMFGIFFCLTMFTIQWKWDFAGSAPSLVAIISFLVIGGIVCKYIPFARPSAIGWATMWIVLFFLYVLIDSYIIMKRYGKHGYIQGVINFYFDIFYMFIRLICSDAGGDVAGEAAGAAVEISISS